jgi:hypothetical protein
MRASTGVLPPVLEICPDVPLTLVTPPPPPPEILFQTAEEAVASEQYHREVPYDHRSPTITPVVQSLVFVGDADPCSTLAVVGAYVGVVIRSLAAIQ